MHAYYYSHTRLPFIGKEGQLQLNLANVLVIGAGGLGCPCLQALAGAGIGHIGIVDFDNVAVPNLHRQTLYNFNDAGQPKATIAQQRLSASNQLIQIEALVERITEKNVTTLLGPYDVIVDATDNFETRYLINDACVALDKPLVYGAIHQHEGHVTVFNYKGSGTLRCLFPSENNEQVESCAVIGAYNVVTGIIGTLMANEVIKTLLQHPDVLANQLLQFDVLDYRMMKIAYKPDHDNRSLSQQRLQTAANTKSINGSSILQKLLQHHPLELIDVRTAEERARFHLGGIHVPMADIEAMQLPAIDKHTTLVVYCQTGKRSAIAAKKLEAAGYSTVYSLQGGIDQWRIEQQDHESNNVP